MTIAVYFICAAILQLSSAQVISYLPRSAVETTTRYVSNVANSINNAMTTPSSNMIARVSTAVPVTNTVAANANANLANINAANAIASQNLANANYANYATAQNANAVANAASQSAVALAANAANVANAAQLANANVVPVASTVPPIVSPANPVANAALASAALASIEGNVATFNLGTNGNTFTITSGSPGTPGFGVSIIADALEVGGTVAVNGQIPIFGSVAVNGNVPTDGAATVTYNCGGTQVPIVV